MSEKITGALSSHFLWSENMAKKVVNPVERIERIALTGDISVGTFKRRDADQIFNEEIY